MQNHCFVTSNIAKYIRYRVKHLRQSVCEKVWYWFVCPLNMYFRIPFLTSFGRRYRNTLREVDNGINRGVLVLATRILFVALRATHSYQPHHLHLGIAANTILLLDWYKDLYIVPGKYYIMHIHSSILFDIGRLRQSVCEKVVVHRDPMDFSLYRSQEYCKYIHSDWFNPTISDKNKCNHSFLYSQLFILITCWEDEFTMQ